MVSQKESNKRKQTRKRIIQAGLDLFQNPGYYGTDIRAIAAKAEIGLGSFYNYYKDKLSLYLDVYKSEHLFIADDFIQLIAKKDKSQLSGLDVIYSLLQFQLNAHNHSAIFYLEADLLALQEPDVQKLKKELDDDVAHSLIPLLAPMINKEVDLEISFPLLYKMTEDTIHSITQKPADIQNRILSELARLMAAYLF